MSGGLLGPDFAKLMSPDRVAPVVGWLASRACDRGGIILSAGAGRVRRAYMVESAVAEVSEEGDFDVAILDDITRAVETRDSRWSSTALIPELTAIRRA
jgi:hypothetical protein